MTCASAPTSRWPAGWPGRSATPSTSAASRCRCSPPTPAAGPRPRSTRRATSGSGPAWPRPGLGPLFVHAPYLVNFASASPVTRERSSQVVAATLAKAASIGAAGVVVHAGQALASGRAAGLAATREALLPLADTATGPDGPDLVLELTAGTRGALAARFEEMAELLAACDHHPRLKVCMDTCHAQAAGYDLGDPIGAAKALDELFATLGGRVVLVHANDSRDPVGAGRDRHCPIGTGTIGDQGFAAILAHPGLATLPVITETTGDPVQMAADLTRLNHLRPTPHAPDAGKAPPDPARTRRGSTTTSPPEGTQ
ncbi:MAG TPA: deoxyribonuclease IV [Actinomycetota bacterium]|nr:deoxyribonuclease IV [Actinomycetota bacterium]